MTFERRHIQRGSWNHLQNKQKTTQVFPNESYFEHEYSVLNKQITIYYDLICLFHQVSGSANNYALDLIITQRYASSCSIYLLWNEHFFTLSNNHTCFKEVYASKKEKNRRQLKEFLVFWNTNFFLWYLGVHSSR